MCVSGRELHPATVARRGITTILENTHYNDRILPLI